jgi:CBS domain-containing protein
MSRELVTISPETTVAVALQEMNRHQVHNIPVVDDKGSFIGLFSLRRLAHALLPMAAQLDEESFHIHIGFLADSSDEYLQRLQTIGRQPVSQLLEKNKKLRFCEPDTSIPRLLQLLSENPASLPVIVVEGQQRKVVGMISAWDILTRIATSFLPAEDGVPSNESSSSDPDIGTEN